MIFLPIVERELRVRARQNSTYRFRTGGALIAIAIVAFMLVIGTAVASPGKFGMAIFNILACLAFIYCLLEGARNTADCLSEEKRAGTLGLLFLTDLKGYDVVLGKLMATSLNSFYTLLAIFPPLALPLLLGGVTAGEFWRLVLVLMNTLFFSLTAGLFVSAASRHERKAWGNTLGIILFFVVLVPLCRLLPVYSASLLGLVSPSTSFFSLYDAAYQANPGRYWQTLGGVHILGWLFLISASIVLPRAWQDQPVRAEVSRAWSAARIGRARAQRPLLNTNPALWLARRLEGGLVYVWILVGLAGSGGLLMALLMGGSDLFLFVLTFALLLLHLILALRVAAQASLAFADARNSGALELLLSTPLTVKEIVQGHFLALKLFFAPPIITLLCLEVTMVLLHILKARESIAIAGVLVVGVVMITFVLDLYAVAWFGLWKGLTSKKAGHAFTRTVLYVLILPFFGLCFGPLWPFIVIIKNLIFINYGRDELHRQFRKLVTERFAAGTQGETWPPEERRAPKSQLPGVIEHGG